MQNIKLLKSYLSRNFAFAVYHVSNLFVLFKLFNIVHVHVYYNVLRCDYAPLWSNTQMHVYLKFISSLSDVGILCIFL